jgi:DNA mismatch repair protein MutS2
MELVSPKSLQDLEWSRLLDALAQRCSSYAGQRRAQSWGFLSSREQVQRSLDEVKEASQALLGGDPLPLGGVRDVEESLARLGIRGTLAPSELREIASTLAAARTLRHYLSRRKESMPCLSAVCAIDPTLDRLEHVLSQSFDADGSLADHASPKLKELREGYRTHRGRMIGRIEELIRRYSDILQDGFWTEREGRYVLPVRSDAHERFPGIVHGTSASGSTLFVEPRVLTPLGNRLKVLEGDIKREEEAIYAALSEEISNQLPSVSAAVEALTHADVRAAMAQMTVDIDLQFVTIDEQPCVDLLSARHPLLQLEGTQVVPSDIGLQPGHSLIVSGPNAGGKTVALKTMGLCALMLLAGLPLPCKSTSRLGLFNYVFSDVGDDQSLQANLSTFSSHIKNLATMLENAGEGSLILLDEIATGTDPREGEALAGAVLTTLCLRKATVMVTTHYEGLKALALKDPRFQNASVGFDVENLTPTFRLALGVPGSSSALIVAKRFGIPTLVLDRAQQFLHRDDRDFETMVQALNEQRSTMEAAQRAAEHAQAAAEQLQAQLKQDIEKIKAREQKRISKEIESLSATVKQARDELQQAREKIKKIGGSREAIQEASRAIDQVAAKVAVGGELERPAAQPERDPVLLSDLRKGLKVFVPRLRVDAEVLEIENSGQVRVAAGPLKLTVRIDEIRKSSTQESNSAGKMQRNSRSEPKVQPATILDENPIQTRDNACDIRGMRVDDALSMVEQYLDRALNQGTRVVFVIHGHGTGALREAIRSRLPELRNVTKFRAGVQQEGGDGATLVWLT